MADSLTQKLEQLNGIEKVDILSELSDVYQYINTKLAIDYAKQGIALAEKINYEKGLASCYGSLGYSYINLDKKDALFYTKKALEIRLRLNDKAGIATSTNVLGVIYYYEGNYLESIEYHLKALQLREEIGNEIRTATSYNNISLVYLALEDFETALDYLNKALKIRIKNNNQAGVSVIKDNIGTIYRRLGKYDKAFEYLQDALKINEQIGNKKSLASNHFGIAKNYQAVNNNEKALHHFNLALEIYNKLNEKQGIAITQNGIASIFINEDKTDLAIKHAHIALEYSESINLLENIAIASNILQSAYNKNGDFENSYKYLTLFKNTSDSLQITEKIKKLARIEFDYKIKKIKEEQTARINEQNILITMLSITLLLLVVIFILIVKGYAHKRNMNLKLNKLNLKLKELNDTRNRFFSIIAHDLRGPFQGMLAYSDFLSSGIDNLNKEEIKEYSKGLNETIQNQYDLLNDLLDWAKLQSANFKTKPETFSLKKDLFDVIEPMSFTAFKKNIEIINGVDDNFSVSADRNMLRLVIRNLISNGIKFTGSNGFVKISAVKKEHHDEIIVSDSGIGISKEEQEKLFRIDLNHSSKGTAGETGSGIGLILCKEIVEKHSGEIKINSEIGKGSTFSFTLKREMKN